VVCLTLARLLVAEEKQGPAVPAACVAQTCACVRA